MPLKAPLSAKSYLARYRQLAPCASIRVSPLCFGTMALVGRMPIVFGQSNREESIQALDYFYDQGGNFLDTANQYGFGDIELFLGEWMALRENRDEMVIATKYSNAVFTENPLKIPANYVGNGSKSMRTAVEASLKRLQTGYIDVLIIHFWDFSTSIPELMQGLNDLVVSGKVNYLGISNAPAWVVSKANQYVRDLGLRQFAVYSGLWNAAVRDFERDIIPMCLDESMGLMPYGCLGEGKFQTEDVLRDRERNNPGRQFGRITDAERNVSRVLEKIAKHKGTHISGVALAYVMHKVPYVIPVVGARNLEHIKGSHQALSIHLSDAEVSEIELANPFDYGYPQTYLSGSQFSGGTPRPAVYPGDGWMTKVAGNFDWPAPVKPIRATPHGERLDLVGPVFHPRNGSFEDYAAAALKWKQDEMEKAAQAASDRQSGPIGQSEAIRQPNQREGAV